MSQPERGRLETEVVETGVDHQWEGQENENESRNGAEILLHFHLAL
jgi:hypothetical protein